ncbi:hypothetical protein LNV47_22615 [Paucibacter sp. DJ4R-1]|nr:hypothetical protein [Paucibacter sp. DJ4R-1]
MPLIQLSLRLADGTRRSVIVASTGTFAALDAAHECWPSLAGGSAKVMCHKALPALELLPGTLMPRVSANNDSFALASA